MQAGRGGGLIIGRAAEIRLVSSEIEIHTGDGAKRVDLLADVAEICECVVVVDYEVDVRAVARTLSRIDLPDLSPRHRAGDRRGDPSPRPVSLSPSRSKRDLQSASSQTLRAARCNGAYGAHPGMARS